MYYGDTGAELFDDIEAATGFRIVGAGYRGASKLTANRPIEPLADPEGLAL